MNWNTIKLFLAVARDGSARAVADRQNISPSTVTRRITDLETELGVKLFNRVSSGFLLTEEGHELMKIAIRMENDAFEIERKLMAKEEVMQGKIRVTIPYHFITLPFMKGINQFSQQYPDIDVELLPSWEPFKLERGEADIAIRLMYKDGQPPEDLIGTKLTEIHCAVYAAKEFADNNEVENPASSYFLGWGEDERKPDWVSNSRFPNLNTRHAMRDPLLQR